MYKMCVIIILLIILLIYFCCCSIKKKYDGIIFYDYGDFEKSKIKICFIAGAHGNEPAGVYSLMTLIKNGYFKKYNDQNNLHIRVIPVTNIWGINHNTRYQFNLLNPDINRNFNVSTMKGNDIVSQNVIDLIKDYDIIVDFHEGWGFHLINNESVGSTISPGNTSLSIELANKSISKINENINDPYKKFITLINKSCTIKGTLSCFCKMCNRHYLLVETSGQNNIQKMSVRQNQIVTVIDTVLNNIN